MYNHWMSAQSRPIKFKVVHLHLTTCSRRCEPSGEVSARKKRCSMGHAQLHFGRHVLLSEISMQYSSPSIKQLLGVFLEEHDALGKVTCRNEEIHPKASVADLLIILYPHGVTNKQTNKLASQTHSLKNIPTISGFWALLTSAQICRSMVPLSFVLSTCLGEFSSSALITQSSEFPSNDQTNLIHSSMVDPMSYSPSEKPPKDMSFLNRSK